MVGGGEDVGVAQCVEHTGRAGAAEPLEAVGGGPLDLGYLQNKGKAILERNFEPSFTLELAVKDASLVEESIQRHELDLPLLRTVRERMEQGVPDHGDEDMSATYWTSTPRSS